VSDDLHTPTNAGPEPAPVTEPVVTEPVTPEPTPVVTEAEATATHPIGTAAYAAPGGETAESPAEKPEVQAAAAFAGGLVLALILKRLGR
jgi:hypothetical protein